jgi:hypothetical protein
MERERKRPRSLSRGTVERDADLFQIGPGSGIGHGDPCVVLDVGQYGTARSGWIGHPRGEDGGWQGTGQVPCICGTRALGDADRENYRVLTARRATPKISLAPNAQ